MFNNFNRDHKALFKIKKIKELNNIKKIVLEICKKVSKKNIEEDFSQIHKKISIKDLNKFRVGVFEELNKLNLHKKLYEISKEEINFLCSNDIAVQKRINISFHLPGDKSSIIDLHSDTLSGQSPFEIVQWIPLCDVQKSNSMYFFNNAKSKKINSKLKNYEKKGFSKILNDFLEPSDFLNINYGQILFFSPTNWHDIRRRWFLAAAA